MIQMWEIIHFWQPLTDYKLLWSTSTGEIWTKILLLLLSYSFWICIFSQVKERSKKVQSWCINIYDILYILKMLYIFWEISILTFDSWLNYFMKTKLEEAMRLCLSLKKNQKWPWLVGSLKSLSGSANADAAQAGCATTQ